MIQIEIVALVLTGLGLAVSILYYANILQNANKARQTHEYMQLFQSKHDLESYKSGFFIMNMNWTDFDDYMSKYSIKTNPQAAAIVESQTSYMEGLGVMVKQNMVDVETVFQMIGTRVILYWLILESMIKEFRKPEWATPDYMKNFEYLAKKMIEMRKQRGLPIPSTEFIHPTSELYD
jgi:hypothetical protein